MPTTPQHDVATSEAGSPQRTPDSPSAKVTDEFHALTSTCGVYDLASRAKIRLTGNDRVRWLNGMVTNNIRDLAVGHGVYAFLLSPQGHILGDLYAYINRNAIIVDTDRFQLEKILATFNHYIIMDDVEVADVSDLHAYLGVAGPKSADVLAAAEITVPSLPLENASQAWHNDHPISIVRGEYQAFPSFQIWIAPKFAAKLREALEKAGARPVNSEALELYRVALGVPRYGQDIRERDLPQETEQQRALNFSKGCYVGQEIVERIRSRGNVHRKFTGFRIEGTLPLPGTKIYLQDKDVGEITSAAVIPTGSGVQRVALGYIRREASGAGKEVRAGDSSARVSDLPFHDLLT